MSKNPMMEIMNILDEHIAGERGNYYWEIEMHHKFSKGQFGGGMFNSKLAARIHMVKRMIKMLEEGE